MSKTSSHLDRFFDERVCPECGKTFFKPVESIYKYHEKGKKGKVFYVCSYTCYVAALKRLGQW